MVHGKADGLTDARVTLNRSARFVIGDVDLRSTKRRTALSPNLFDDVYAYSCPTDLKENALIDVIPQVNRSSDWEPRLTTEEEFDRRKTIDLMMVAFSDRDFTRKILIAATVDDDELLISELEDTTSGGGTWSGFGDGTNLTADRDNFVKGNASLNWDISAAGGTTAGIQNSSLNTFDLTDFLSAGSVFVWHYITSTTNITNYILRIGNDSSNYYSKTITATHEGTAFVTGWNLLRFDLFTASETGTVDDDDCDYVALYMTKDAGKVSETDYRFDWLVVKRGKIHDLLYYSKYAWQSSSGTYLEDSTADTDLLNADTAEYELFNLKGAEFAAQELRDYEDAKYFFDLYEKKKLSYLASHPSERKLLVTSYYEFGSAGSAGSENI